VGEENVNRDSEDNYINTDGFFTCLASQHISLVKLK